MNFFSFFQKKNQKKNLDFDKVFCVLKRGEEISGLFLRRDKKMERLSSYDLTGVGIFGGRTQGKDHVIGR